MASVVSKVMTTVNAPYGVAVSPAELAARLADPESASVCDHAAFAFLSEVAPHLQHQFIDEMGIGMEDWTFRGGTALMLQIGHRDSHDIDLFISDAQYLPFLNPEVQGYDLSLAPSGYDGRNACAQDHL